MQPLPPLPASPFADGGESLIFVHPTRSDLLVKVFTDSNHVRQPRSGGEAAHIESLNEFQNGITYSHRVLLSSNFSWPIEIYGTRQGVIDGIGILRAPDDFEIEITKTTVPKKKYFLHAGYLTTDTLERRNVVSATFRHISFEDRVEIALEYLYSFQVLWELGYRFCDYKEQNFAFTLNGRPRVFIVDAESVSPPNGSRMRSPDWDPPPRLGFTMESDRSLACLLVWRLLAQTPGLKPPDRGVIGFLDRLDDHTLTLLEDGYLNGTQDQIDDLVRSLSRHRSAENIRKGFEWAVGTQLATMVLRYAPPNPTAQEAQILVDAREQRVLEEELMALNPRLRQLRKNRSVPRPGFRFDIPDTVVIDAIDRDTEIIRQLALEGEFEEVAQAFKGRKSSAPVNQVATRAIQAAIARLGPPPVRTRQSPSGEFRADWSWPGTDVVTGARIRLYWPDGTLAQEGYCDRAKRNPSLTFSARANVPDGSRLVVCYGMHFDDGVAVVCPLGTETTIRGMSAGLVPPTTVVTTTAGGGGATPPGGLTGDLSSITSEPLVGIGAAIGITGGVDVGGTVGTAGGPIGGLGGVGGSVPPGGGGAGAGGKPTPPIGEIPTGVVRRLLNGIGGRLFGRGRR